MTIEERRENKTRKREHTGRPWDTTKARRANLSIKTYGLETLEKP